jgi:hypothetical protein
MRLATEEVLDDHVAAWDAARAGLPAHENSDLLDDPVSGRALRSYLMLTETPVLIAGLGLSAEDVFWSRYYWLLRYARLREATVGRDAGLEQQVSQILEHPDPPCDPDWSVLEAVEARAERDAAAQLGIMPDGPTASPCGSGDAGRGTLGSRWRQRFPRR